MNEFLFEYFRDPEEKKCCLNCMYYSIHMEQFDAKNVAQVNGVKVPHKYGQKYCIKNKVFVYFIDACGGFLEI